MFFAKSLGLDIFAPNGSIGIFILGIGLIFSLVMCYVGYISMNEMYAKESKRQRDNKRTEQKAKIARLYPQS